jgi:hypothetical protein
LQGISRGGDVLVPAENHSANPGTPYLHDGSAVTVKDVLTTRNPKDEHGKTSQLTPQQIEDLAEYVLSL